MIYCYDQQLRAVQTFFRDVQIRPLRNAEPIKALEMQTFVYVTPHGKPVPPYMMEMLKAKGFVIIHVDEQHARDFFAPRRK